VRGYPSWIGLEVGRDEDFTILPVEQIACGNGVGMALKWG